ncbi:MAG: DUF3568 family protein [Candidatus Methylomirabilales bacterium]
MSRNAKMRFSLSLLAIGLTSCAPLGAVTSLTSTAITGAFYARSQTVERTFVAPMEEVKEACRRTLEEMAFTIKQEEVRENENYIVASAADDYEVDVTITSITPKATRVSIKADSLLERDKATGLEIITQMAATLFPPPPPPQLLASPTNLQGMEAPPMKVATASPLLPPSRPVESNPSRLTPPPPQPFIGVEPPPIPVVTSVEPTPPQSLAPVGPLPAVVNQKSPAVTRPAHREPPRVVKPRTEENGETPTPQQLYETAINDYIEGDFPAVIRNLRGYLASQPDSSQASKAHYWLGESLYSQREYADALVQFKTILRDYPRSPESPRALFKSAHAYRQLGQTLQAEALLKTLIKHHPKSREANLARMLMAGR